MPTSTWRRPASDALALAGVLLLAVPAAADYRDSYRRGIDAAGHDNWSETARLMRAALAEQPREGETVPLADGRPAHYLPRYYLGLALFHGGDCQGARREWERSRRQGAILRSPVLKTVDKLDQECLRRLTREAGVAESARTAESEVQKGEKLASAIATLESNPALGSDKQAAVGRGVREARERLAQARSKLDAGRRDSDPGDFAKARTLALRALEGLEKTRREAMKDMDVAAPAASLPAPAASLPPATLPPSSLGAPPAGPPPELLAAASAYFEGRYQEAVAALDAAHYEAGPAALQVHLLRAAARHALYVLDGQRDRALREAIAADVQAVRRLDPSFEPDPSAFSPRFRELFRKGG
jgi:hypothetical protein